MEDNQNHYKIFLDNLSKRLAMTSLKIGAIKLRPEDPFEWVSGYRMPIYNDNRLLLCNADYRQQVAEVFGAMMTYYDINPSIIAGTSTSGIPPATTLADRLGKPLIYVRDKPKDHGLHNQIEGIPDESDLKDKRILLIEDLISTGGSSAKTVQAIRNAKGSIDTCFAIFTYELDKATNMFAGIEPYDKETGEKLSTPCIVRAALTYNTLLEVAEETGYLKEAQVEMLKEWRADPFNWGANHGFPKVEKQKK